ncbi:MAG: prepilin-type N-terminal cleavage/methylation domain-containing protein [Candidatus Omnitrophica bacterium]|nr:prepilin-type N-terminal cleavage/methylation domain-containing protein [Candidatus Omnitrophota bacterium]MBU4478803.1 prepilin-type N-terminal cleavage/methylation domain-containing protein [Candidatus Omnitrophota bacterium]MCG2702874.1 prepilin-type N-terminal cleavage/methylation domain-containing protein [Candidatus Omnitrophota bacterium]
MKKSKNRQGFTLIELLIVVGLIGVLTFLGLPYYRPFLQYISLKNDVWTVLSDLRGYRQLAIIEHVNYRVLFNVGSDSYTVEQRDAATDTFIQTVANVTLDSNLIQADDTTFRPMGDAVPASTIVLQGKNPADKITITVYSTTGLARMRE